MTFIGNTPARPAWLVALKHEKPITDSEEAYQKVKEEDLAKHKLVWLPYARFDNTYTIMMRKKDAEQLGIKSISDLASGGGAIVGKADYFNGDLCDEPVGDG